MWYLSTWLYSWFFGNQGTRCMSSVQSLSSHKWFFVVSDLTRHVTETVELSTSDSSDNTDISSSLTYLLLRVSLNKQSRMNTHNLSSVQYVSHPSVDKRDGITQTTSGQSHVNWKWKFGSPNLSKSNPDPDCIESVWGLEEGIPEGRMCSDGYWGKSTRNTKGEVMYTLHEY